MKRLVTMLASAALIAAAPALAHHGWSSYDNDNLISLTGTIVEADYSYPHASIKLEAEGKVWIAVLAPPSRMSARGLPSADLRPGIQATVEGYPSRKDTSEMRAERIVLDGKTTELR